MEISEIVSKLSDHEKRILFQEAIHDKVLPDGNRYHWDFRFRDVLALVFVGAVIGTATYVICNKIFK